jgi:peroxiredoxin
MGADRVLLGVMKTRTVLAAIGVIGAVSALALAQEGLYLPAGSEAPPLSGVGTDGKEYSLTGLTKEKPAFVVFWKQRCPHNARASALFNALNKAYEGKVQVIGVVNAPAEGAKAWVDQFSLNYPLLADADKATIKAYKLRFSITTMQIGTDGKIAKVFEGYGAEAMASLNEAMAKAAGTEVAKVDLTGAPGRLTWG